MNVPKKQNIFERVIANLFRSGNKKQKYHQVLEGSTLSALDRNFLECCNDFFTLEPDLTDEEKLRGYGLYKQATEGDCTLVKPHSLMRKRLIKYNAWRAQRGMAPLQAKKLYVDLVNEFRESLGPPKITLKHSGIKKESKHSMEELSLDKIEEVLRPSNQKRPMLNTNTLTKQMFPHKQIDRSRASFELSVFLSRDPDVQNGMVFKDDKDFDLKLRSGVVQPDECFSSDEAIRRKSSWRSTDDPVSIRNDARAAFVNNGRNRSSMRNRFQATDAEYRRFTLMRVNQSVVSSMFVTTQAGSFISFARSSYQYKGPTLQQMLAQGRRERDSIRSVSALLAQGDERYTDVCCIVHQLSVEYQKSFSNSRVNDKFGTNVRRGIPIDKFMLRLVRYLDRWFEETPGVNSAGARSMLITRMYVDKLKKNMEDFSMTQQNIFRILSVCMLVATKFCEDCIIANAYWAEVAGITVEDLNNVEELFCSITEFDLYVKDDDFDKVCKKYGLVKSNNE